MKFLSFKNLPNTNIIGHNIPENVIIYLEKNDKMTLNHKI